MLRDDPAARKFEDLFGPEYGNDKPIERARVRKALTALNSPQWNLPPTFHVAGGAGKGSTIAFMRSIAEAAGLSVHVFSAPHLLDLRERFRVSGKLVSTQELVELAERLSYLRVELTHFEAQVVCAFSLFANNTADLTFIETGAGGRDDATNVIPSPIATILTAISLDDPHMSGDRVVAVAKDKSGIMKGGVPMVMARQHEDVKLVVEQAAQRLGTPLFGGGVEWNAYGAAGSMALQYQTRAFNLPPPALIGAHQIDNAGLAAATLLTWGDRRITPLAVATGVASVQCRARLELLTYGPLFKVAGSAEVWIDSGSGAQAAAAIALAIREMSRKRRVLSAAIIGAPLQSNWRAFIERIAPEVDLVIGAPLGVHGADASDIAEVVQAQGIEAKSAETLRGAVIAARESGAERIFICGSFALAGEALQETRAIE